MNPEAPLLRAALAELRRRNDGGGRVRGRASYYVARRNVDGRARFTLQALRVGYREQLVAAGEVPLAAFAPTALQTEITMDACMPGQDITIMVRALVPPAPGESAIVHAAIQGDDEQGRMTMLPMQPMTFTSHSSTIQTVIATPQRPFRGRRLVIDVGHHESLGAVTAVCRYCGEDVAIRFRRTPPRAFHACALAHSDACAIDWLNRLPRDDYTVAVTSETPVCRHCAAPITGHSHFRGHLGPFCGPQCRNVAAAGEVAHFDPSRLLDPYDDDAAGEAPAGGIFRGGTGRLLLSAFAAGAGAELARRALGPGGRPRGTAVHRREQQPMQPLLDALRPLDAGIRRDAFGGVEPLGLGEESPPPDDGDSAEEVRGDDEADRPPRRR